MGFLKIILILNIFWINGCASSKALEKKKTGPLTMVDIYRQSSGQSPKDMADFIENNLKEQESYGYTKPYIPVMNEPVVRKVWVPTHKAQDNSDVMIAGHWNYVMIHPPTWFIDNEHLDAGVSVIIPTAKEKEQSNKP